MCICRARGGRPRDDLLPSDGDRISGRCRETTASSRIMYGGTTFSNRVNKFRRSQRPAKQHVQVRFSDTLHGCIRR